MLKILLIISIILVVSFLLCFPFWHVGGNYYRGLLLIYDIRKASGGFLPAPDFLKEVTLVKWADPTSFEYVGDNYAKDRFSVYSQYRLDGFDPKTFRPIQAAITGEIFYADKNNLRTYSNLILKQIPNNAGEADSFDMETLQLLGAYIFKDKNGVYVFSKTASFSEDMHQSGGWGDRNVDLFVANKELDTKTFSITSCDETYCYASDKNNKYQIKRAIRPFTKSNIRIIESEKLFSEQ